MFSLCPGGYMSILEGFLEDARAVHRGEKGLGKSFWGWLWFPHVVLGLVLIAIAYNDARFYRWAGSNLLFESLNGLFDAIIVAWIIYFGVGVWRSAGRAVSRFWGIVTRIILVFWFLAILSYVAQLLGIPTQSQLAIVSEQMPLKNFTWTSAGETGGILTVKGNVTNAESAISDGPSVSTNVCQLFGRYLRSKSLTRVDVEYWAGHTLIARYPTTGTDCGRSQ